MDPSWTEWANVFLRFIHVLAAIMWIGNSLLFTWMEFSLSPPAKDPATGQPRDPDLLGSLDMLHGGGVFHLEKRALHGDAIPERLFWFKWQSYTTWISGFLLLSVLFYHNGSSLLDASKSSLAPAHGALVSLGGIVFGWLAYDALWRSPAGGRPALAIALSFLLLGLAAWFFDLHFNGRALFLQLGAMMGSFMSANVFVHIMGNQHRFMRSLRAGRPYDPSFGRRAKMRSLHNHYMTFPVLFLMLSSHFPLLHASPQRVPIALVLIAGLMGVKHFMNARHRSRHWGIGFSAAIVLPSLLIGLLLHLPAPASADTLPAVARGEKLFLVQGCAACHMQGSSAIAPSLHGIYLQPQTLVDGSRVVADETYLRQSILQPAAQIVHGYSPAMPPYEGRLTPEELDDLIAYIQSLR